jgi:SAM-dependent MidA family methyltransferase
MDSELVLGGSHLLKPVGKGKVYVYTFDYGDLQKSKNQIKEPTLNRRFLHENHHQFLENFGKHGTGSLVDSENMKEPEQEVVRF